MVQAQLVTPKTHESSAQDCGFGFASPQQDAPYGVDLQLRYAVNLRHPHPDNYADSHGFSLYSARLIELFRAYEVRFEYFPVTMEDQDGKQLPHLEYSVFHSLEGVLPAMDEAKSGWTGDWDDGIPSLILDYGRFPHRPLFLCNHLYLKLMRHDLKLAIEESGISGFGFLKPAEYCSGKYGFAPNYHSTNSAKS